jgi:hypothetical protein
MEKVIREGKVAVLYSPGFTAGWYTWSTSEDKRLIFDPKLVEMVENERNDEITEEWLLENLGLKEYCGGAKDLEIEWIPEGTPFTIDCFDGNESIITAKNFDLIA